MHTSSLQCSLYHLEIILPVSPGVVESNLVMKASRVLHGAILTCHAQTPTPDNAAATALPQPLASSVTLNVTCELCARACVCCSYYVTCHFQTAGSRALFHLAHNVRMCELGTLLFCSLIRSAAVECRDIRLQRARHCWSQCEVRVSYLRIQPARSCYLVAGTRPPLQCHLLCKQLIVIIIWSKYSFHCSLYETVLLTLLHPCAVGIKDTCQNSHDSTITCCFS